MRMIFAFCYFLLVHTSSAQWYMTGACAPQKGSCTTCDSLGYYFHENALNAVFHSAQDTASPYFDSIYLPIHLVDRVEKAMVAVYNWLPDSLDLLRNFHFSYQGANTYTARPWNQFIIAQQRDKRGKPKRTKPFSEVLKIFAPDTVYTDAHGQQIGVSSRPVNPYVIQRKIKPIGWTIYPYTHLSLVWEPPVLDIAQTDEGMVLSYTVSFGHCMPPELPCARGRWQFLVRNNCSVGYLSFQKLR